MNRVDSRADLLDRRTVSRDFNEDVDRSIRSLTVSADRAPAMLTALRHAADLNHIDSIRIERCANATFSASIVALSALRHGQINLELTRETLFDPPLNAQSLSLLATIAPASLHLKGNGMFSNAEVGMLAQLTYPLSLSAPAYWDEADIDVCRLAGIPTLVLLDVYLNEFNDQTARAFQGHSALKALHLHERGINRVFSRGLVISDGAVETLAGIASLRTLHIDATAQAMGPKAFTALAANTTLQHLKIGTFRQWFEESAAVALSMNTALKSLEMPLKAGSGHLAKMASLEVLSLTSVYGEGRSEIRTSDAQQFARHARLKSLSIDHGNFEGNALAVLASSAVENLAIHTVVLSHEAIEALLANRALKSLKLALSTGLDTSVAHALALAAHPTLTTLTVKLSNPDNWRGHDAPKMTNVQRAAIYEAWGGHRDADGLTIDL